MTRRLSLLIAIVAVLVSQQCLWAQRICPLLEGGDLLEEKLPVVKAAMPGRGSNGFVVPSADEMTSWRALTASMIQGNLGEACRIIAVNNFPYSVIQFSDVATAKTYNILQEDIPEGIPNPKVAKGWGTYLFNPSATTSLSIEIPHPLFDLLTPEQGIDSFRQIDARTLLIAGTHRFANDTESSCQPTATVPSSTADVAHNIQNMFEPAHEVIAAELPNTLFIQLHGNRQQPDCVDVFVGNGTTSPGPLANRIVDCLQGSSFSAEAATENSICPLRGTTNIQGRFSNGSRNLCSLNAETASEKFIHIEQSPDVRQAGNRQALIDALLCAVQ